MTKQDTPTEISDADLDNAVGGGDVAIQTISLQHEGFEQNSLKPKLTDTDGKRAGIRAAGVRAGIRATRKL